MAVRKVGARVEIDGEREYKAALSDLNNGNRVLASEMRKLQAEYKGNAESTEYLTKRGEVLERQLLQQKDKVETLRQALNNAAQQYGEADSRTQAWAVKLNDAEAAQYNLEHAIEENNEALKANDSQLKAENESLVSVGDTVDDLAGKFGVRLPDGLKKALDNMQGFSAGTVLAMTTAAAGVAALAKVVSELHDITKQAAADVDEILTESMTTGLSTRTIQQLKYAENLIDVSYSTITGTLTRLTRNMDQARDGNEAMAASFASLGVAIQDGTTGQLRDVESVFYEIIDALGQIENPTERDAAAMELLGKSAQELNPLILQGSSALKDLADQAEATGYVLDDSMLKKLGEVDDAVQQLDLQTDTFQKRLAVQFAPASKAAMETFANVTKAAGDTLERSGLIKGLAEILASLTGLLEPLAALLGITPGLTNELQPLYEVLHAIAGVIALIADTGNAAIGFLTGFTASGRQRFNTALGLNAASGQYSNMQRWDGTAARYQAASEGNWAVGSDGKYASAYTPDLGGSQSSSIYWDSLNGVYREHGTGNVYTPTYNGVQFTPEQWEQLAEINHWNASGNQNWQGGLTYVGENGPEAAILPRGTQILNAQDTRGLGGDTYYITIDAKNVREFNDIVEIARTARVRGRMK